MKSLVFLTLLLPAVLSRVAYDLNINNLHQGITKDDLKEIQKLNILTKQLNESGGRFKPPFHSPLKISEKDVSFYVYNRQNSDQQDVLLEEAQNIASVSSFDTSLKTIVVIHGWHNNYNSTFNFLVGQAYVEVRDVNIISVDWDKLAMEIYAEAFAAVPQVGHYVGQFIKNISSSYDYSLDNISLVGHSLGAHVSGFAGQETNGTLASITGLDPAGPLFFEWLPNERLSDDDAQYVQSIHTDASLLGVNYNVGHADYWPNGGHSQPGCSVDLTGTCAHSRSYLYFVESLTSDEFIAKGCDSYADYTAGKCKSNASTVMGGADVNTELFGVYYLQTNSSSPYALGETDF